LHYHDNHHRPRFQTGCQILNDQMTWVTNNQAADWFTAENAGDPARLEMNQQEIFCNNSLRTVSNNGNMERGLSLGIGLVG
jgi:hypothetical protein